MVREIIWGRRMTKPTDYKDTESQGSLPTLEITVHTQEWILNLNFSSKIDKKLKTKIYFEHL